MSLFVFFYCESGVTINEDYDKENQWTMGILIYINQFVEWRNLPYVKLGAQWAMTKSLSLGCRR